MNFTPIKFTLRHPKILGAMGLLGLAAVGTGVGAGVAHIGPFANVANVSSPPASPGPTVCGNSLDLNGPSSAPSGAITVASGNNSSVTWNTANKVYWFAPGTHTLGTSQFNQIQPGANSTYEGAPGAILSGQFDNDYAFVGQSGSNSSSTAVEGVTIEYLTVEDFVPPAGNGAVNVNSEQHWTIRDNTIQDNAPGSGLMIGSDDTVDTNCLTANGEYGFDAYSGTDGDPLTNGVANITLNNNEISFNDTCDEEATQPFPFGVNPPSPCQWQSVNSSAHTGTPGPPGCSGSNCIEWNGCGCDGGGKFWEDDQNTITNNYVHDNENDGIWEDTNNIGSLVQYNWFSDNYGPCFEYEISYNAAILDNSFIGCAVGEGANGDTPGFPDAAIYLSESGSDPNTSGPYQKTFDIEDNYFDDNWSNVILWENSNRACSTVANSSASACTLDTPSSFNMKNSKSPPGSYTGTCGTYNTGPGTDTESVALQDSNPTQSPDIYYGCRWRTENVLVAGNTFNLDADSGSCSPSNSGAGCMPTACTANNECGYSGTFSEDGTIAPYTGYGISNAIATTQNNVFCDNHYQGAGTPEFMVPLQGDKVSMAEWQTAWSQDALTCPNGPPPTTTTGGGGTTTTTTSGSTTTSSSSSTTTTSTTVPPTTTTTLPPTFQCAATASAQGNGTVTTNALSAAPGDKLVALVASSGRNNQRQTVTVAGGQLNWTRVTQTNSEQGDVEIWTATPVLPVSDATFTSTPEESGYDQMLYVCAYSDALGFGAGGSSWAYEGAPEMRVVARATGSQMFLVGIDPSAAIARTPIGSQSLTEWVDTGEGVTFWWQSAPSPGAGDPIILGDISPTKDKWNLAALEVTPLPGQ